MQEFLRSLPIELTLTVAIAICTFTFVFGIPSLFRFVIGKPKQSVAFLPKMEDVKGGFQAIIGWMFIGSLILAFGAFGFFGVIGALVLNLMVLTLIDNVRRYITSKILLKTAILPNTQCMNNKFQVVDEIVKLNPGLTNQAYFLLVTEMTGLSDMAAGIYLRKVIHNQLTS